MRERKRFCRVLFALFLSLVLALLPLFSTKELSRRVSSSAPQSLASVASSSKQSKASNGDIISPQPKSNESLGALDCESCGPLSIASALSNHVFQTKTNETLSWPRDVHELGPMCIGPDHLILPVPDYAHEDAIRCRLANNPSANCTTKLPILPTHLLPRLFTRMQEKQLSFWRDDVGEYFDRDGNVTNVQDANVWSHPLMVHVRKTSLLVDSGVGAPHFGHMLSTVISLISMLESDDKFKHDIVHLVDFLWRQNGHPRWNSVILDTLFSWVNITHGDRQVDRPFLLREPLLASGPLKALCFENVVTLEPKERTFHTKHDVKYFQAACRKILPTFSPTLDSCPQPKAAVLYRSGLGAGLRKIMNYDAIQDALQENDITTYTNVTVAQDTSLAEAVEVFSSVGLLITTHSSQLKLLAFAHPGTIVIELRPKESAKWFGHSVFSEGPDVLGVHYFSHCQHKAGTKCPMSEEVCQIKGNIYSDVLVNKTALSSVLREALAIQNKRCELEWR